jgi:hypothetical protein
MAANAIARRKFLTMIADSRSPLDKLNGCNVIFVPFSDGKPNGRHRTW